jgi:hypothetical protein
MFKPDIIRTFQISNTLRKPNEERGHDTQHNDIQHNDTQHNGI